MRTLGLSLALAGCGGAGADGSGGGGTATSTSGGTTTGGDGGAADGADAEEPCEVECNVVADCCTAFGAINTAEHQCPGDYPNNWTCTAQGECVNECTSDADCNLCTGESAGQDCVFESWQCLPVGGIDTCFLPCTSNADCNDEVMPGTKCDGQADNGVEYCKPSTL